MTTLFISDLHLDDSRPAMTAAFLHLLENAATQADALYILGDFFEAWVGDDNVAPLTLDVIAALRRLTDTGVPVYLMQGNRDFLFGGRFCKMSGCILLPDPTAINLYGRRTLLMHGDSLCTDDHSYMRIRPILRSRLFKFVMYCFPLRLRYKLAKKARAKSKQATGLKSPMSMDANLDAIKKSLQEHQATLLIHGHTHQPAIQHLSLGPDFVTRIVLSDWYEKANVLVCEANGELRLIYPE